MLSGTSGGSPEDGPCGNRTPSPNTFIPTWLWYYTRAYLTTPQTQSWWARFVTTWPLPGCQTASSCCHLTRSGKLLIGIMKPPPEWGWSNCINPTRSSQTYTSSTTVSISRFWVCQIRRYSLAQPMSSSEATWCAGTWQRVARRHMLCFPLGTCLGQPLQLPVPRTHTDLVVPDFRRNIRPSMLSSWLRGEGS